MKNLEIKIAYLESIGLLLKDQQYIRIQAETENSWFTQTFIEHRFQAIVNFYLDREKLWEWVEANNLIKQHSPDITVGLICAGNIPLAGLHDILSCFICGTHVQIKLSSKDYVLMRWFVEHLQQYPDNNIQIVEMIQEVDKLILTGSDLVTKQLEEQYKGVKILTRNHKTGIAVLFGDESIEDLENIAQDILLYFGLGCRSVSKIYYQNEQILRKLEQLLISDNMHLLDNLKYRNNVTYQQAIMKVEGFPVIYESPVIISSSQKFISPLGHIYTEQFDKAEALSLSLQEHAKSIQCVISIHAIPGLQVIAPGTAQLCGLNVWQDEKNTLEFILNTAHE